MNNKALIKKNYRDFKFPVLARILSLIKKGTKGIVSEGQSCCSVQYSIKLFVLMSDINFI